MVEVAPSAISVEPTVTELFNNLAFSILPASLAFVIPRSLTLTAPEPSVADNSIVSSSTVTSISSALAVIPSPPTTFNVLVEVISPPPVNP